MCWKTSREMSGSSYRHPWGLHGGGLWILLAWHRTSGSGETEQERVKRAEREPHDQTLHVSSMSPAAREREGGVPLAELETK